MAPDILGFLGLNSASNSPGGPFEINPVIGVRHQVLERSLAELTGQKPHGYAPPSLSSPLGYLMPEARYRAWFFGDEGSVDETAASLTEAVVAYGVPFMHRHDTLSSIIDDLAATKRAAGDQASMHLALGYALLGARDEARSILDQNLEELEKRQDLAADYFRKFADALSDQGL